MNLNTLRFVIAIDEERHFRRAAERCYVSQPALTIAIQKLEEELGVTLFERNKAQIEPTAIGAQIIAQAQQVLEEINKLKALAEQGQDPLAGALRLGVIYTIGPYLLPELIPRLHRSAPKMPLVIEENLTATLFELLKRGKLDAVIMALPFEGAGIATMPLYDEDFVVVVPIEHAWARAKNIAAPQLANVHLLLLNHGHCFSNQVIEACPELNQRGGEITPGNSLETIRNMVASGLGITVLPCSAMSGKYHNKLIKAVPFAGPAPSRRVAIAWRKSYTRVPAIMAVAEAIKKIDSRCLQLHRSPTPATNKSGSK